MNNPRYHSHQQLSNQQLENAMHLHHDLAERAKRNKQLQHINKPFYTRWYYAFKFMVWG